MAVSSFPDLKELSSFRPAGTQPDTVPEKDCFPLWHYLLLPSRHAAAVWLGPALPVAHHGDGGVGGLDHRPQQVEQVAGQSGTGTDVSFSLRVSV